MMYKEDQIQVEISIIKLAQYLSGLTSRQDIWEESAKALVNFLRVKLVAFGDLDEQGRGFFQHVSFLKQEASEKYYALFQEDADSEVSDELKNLISETYQSGFLHSSVIKLQAPICFLFLPVVTDNKTAKVLVISELNEKSFSEFVLNAYLAVARLFGNIAGRLKMEEELKEHRWQLEKIVEQRTNELKQKTISLKNEIVHRKQAEDEVKRKNRSLEKINAEKDKFFSIIAHDLKSPFNSIMGFSKLLVKQINEKNYNGIEKYAEIIQQSSQKAVNLLMNLMEWAQSQTGRIAFKPEPFDLKESIHDITSLFDDVAGQKGIVIKSELPPKAIVFADQSMMNTVLRNLISNAVKFTRQDGEIILAVTKDERELTVSVKDNGIGISQEQVEKLFRIEEIESTPGTANEKGTGLGLILCKEFVEKHAGKIWAESEEGKGSTFYFTLPYNTEPVS